MTEKTEGIGLEKQLVALGVNPQDAATAAMGLFLLARVEKPEDIRNAAHEVDRCLSFGPFFDPTLFMKCDPATGRRNKDLLRKLADLLEELQQQKAALTAEGKIG